MTAFCTQIDSENCMFYDAECNLAPAHHPNFNVCQLLVTSHSYPVAKRGFHFLNHAKLFPLIGLTHPSCPCQSFCNIHPATLHLCWLLSDFSLNNTYSERPSLTTQSEKFLLFFILTIFFSYMACIVLSN